MSLTHIDVNTECIQTNRKLNKVPSLLAIEATLPRPSYILHHPHPRILLTIQYIRRRVSFSRETALVPVAASSPTHGQRPPVAHPASDVTAKADNSDVLHRHRHNSALLLHLPWLAALVPRPDLRRGSPATSPVSAPVVVTSAFSSRHHVWHGTGISSCHGNKRGKKC